VPRVEALDLVAGWPVPNAAAGVVDPDGVVATTGDVDRPFALASVTKLLTAWTTLIAVEEGSVDLDEPAGPPGSTVRHLLAHTSGLAFDAGPPIGPPGRTRIYSNAGYEALGNIVAERTGFAFTEYLREAVLAPLGMTATALDGSPAADGRGPLVDLLRFARELLVPTLLSPATVALATTVAFPGLRGVVPGIGRFDPCDWGLGPELHDGKAPHWMPTTGSAAAFGHFGGSGTFLWVDPEARVACVGLTDRQFGTWAMDVWPPFSDAVLAAHRAATAG
jgi:CubicO group peptidase (beta-lactamase class C family)